MAAPHPRLSESRLLSCGEAACALRDYRDGRAALLQPQNRLQRWGADVLRYGGGETVAHYGGAARVIESALQFRHMFARAQAEAARNAAEGS